MKACIFCDKREGKITGEHVFPDWIRTELSLSDESEAEIIQPDGTGRRWKVKPFTQKVNDVCINCNNGWMADLEAEVKPLLQRMISGGSIRLGGDRQRALALWSTKTALMVSAMHSGYAVLPESERRQICDNAQPSAAVLVWVSRRTPIADERGLMIALSRSRSIIKNVRDEHGQPLDNLPEDARCGVVMFAIGDFVVTVFGHNIPARLDLEVVVNATSGARLDDHFQQVWPIVRHHFHWPRHSLNEIGGVESAFQIWG